MKFLIFLKYTICEKKQFLNNVASWLESSENIANCILKLSWGNCMKENSMIKD